LIDVFTTHNSNVNTIILCIKTANYAITNGKYVIGSVLTGLLLTVHADKLLADLFVKKKSSFTEAWAG